MEMKMDIETKLHQSLKMISSRNTHLNSLIIHGRGGLGKTSGVVKNIEKLGINYSTFMGKFTTLGFWNFIQEECEKGTDLLLLDDCTNLLSNETILGFLKGLTGKSSDGNTVEISYADQSGTRKINFNSSVCIITNTIKKSAISSDLDAVKDRAIFLEYDLSYQELLSKMREIVDGDAYSGLSKEVKREVFKLIEKYSSPLTPDLSLRTLIKAFDCMIALERIEAEQFIINMLKVPKRDSCYDLIIELHRSDKLITEQVDEWCKRTKLSRRSYFLKKKQLKNMGSL
jgi:uncharacterized protein YlzI (FlbEa/FlbD family)